MNQMKGCSGEKGQQKEADYFAMHLLVPDRLLIKESYIDLTDDDQLLKMATRYKVPVGVMVTRLTEFYAKPHTEKDGDKT